MIDKKEYAIILSFENGERCVSYIKATRFEAMQEAKNQKRIAAAIDATIAVVSGFIGVDDDEYKIDEVSDFERGYYEARGSIGHTYMSNHYKLSTPEWYDRESEEYKRGFSAGIASLATF